MKKLLLVLSLAGLTACASFAPAPPPPAKITYRADPCFGKCPVYTIAVSADGVAAFQGIKNTSVAGRRLFVIRPDEFSDFSAALAPYRPTGEKIYSAENCPGPVATDAPGVDIRWSDEQGEDHLYAYFGCDLEVNRAMYQALADAPDLLPLDLYLSGR